MKGHTFLAQGLSSWINFEAYAGREPLFSEYYIANPLGQLLFNRYKEIIITEYEHPVLSSSSNKRGRKSSIDFVVLNEKGEIKIAIETKWLSKSSTLDKDIVKDLIRLSLLYQNHSKKLYLILAGKKSNYDALFQKKHIQPYPKSKTSSSFFPINNRTDGVIHLDRSPKFREKFISNILQDFIGIKIPTYIRISTSGYYPKYAKYNDYVVHIWSIYRKPHEQIISDFIPC